jgi:hypothetical protein
MISGFPHTIYGRAGSGYTAFDYDRMKNLGPKPKEGAHSLEEMWKNVTYFLEGHHSRGKRSEGADGAASE